MTTLHVIFNSWITYVIIAFMVSVVIVLVKKSFVIVLPPTIVSDEYVRNTFQLELGPILYRDRMHDSIVLHPVIGAESLSQLEAWSDNLMSKEQKLKHALREYLLTVTFKEVDRLTIEEIIKENYLTGGVSLNSLKIEFASLPESLTW